MTKSYSLKYGLWVLEIIGVVALIQSGLPISYVGTLVRFCMKKWTYSPREGTMVGLYMRALFFIITQSPGGNMLPSAGTGAASISGGYFYQSMTDPCFYGRYLFTDVYVQTIWAGTEQPENSENFTSRKMPLELCRGFST